MTALIMPVRSRVHRGTHRSSRATTLPFRATTRRARRSRVLRHAVILVFAAGVPAAAADAASGATAARPEAGIDSAHPGPAQAPDSAAAALEARTTAVASRLRCPVCQGLSIQDSPDETSREMRALIRDQLASGRTEAEVESYFVERYGEWILMQPRHTGFNLLVYLLPGLALAAGLALLVVLVRRWSAESAHASAAADAADPDLAPWEEIRPGR